MFAYLNYINYKDISSLFINHKDISVLLCIGIIILLFLIRIIFRRLDKRIKKIRITMWTYIGAICYPVLLMIMLFTTRRLFIPNDINVKELLSTINKLEFRVIDILLFSLICIIIFQIIILVFSTIVKLLEYQLWKLYIYYRHKIYYKEDDYYRVKILDEFERRWSYHHFCLTVTQLVRKFAYKNNFVELYNFARYPDNWFPVIRSWILGGIFIFLFAEYYCRNGVIGYLQYYLLFSVIFVLWYKFSMFLRVESPFINQVLYERTYCAPKIIYINLTREEEELLELYKEKPYHIIIKKLKTMTQTTDMDIYIEKRFLYVSTEGLASLNETTGEIQQMKEPYMYVNRHTSKGFYKEDLQEKTGKYYVDIYTIKK